MNSNQLSKSYNSKFNKTDPNLSKTLASQKSSILNKTLKNKLLMSTTGGMQNKSKINNECLTDLDKSKLSEEKANEKVDLLSSLQQQYNQISYDINKRKQENEELKKSFNTSIKTIKKENENLRKSQKLDKEEKLKNITEYTTMNELLRDEILKLKKLIEEKKVQIKEAKEL